MLLYNFVFIAHSEIRAAFKMSLSIAVILVLVKIYRTFITLIFFVVRIIYAVITIVFSTSGNATVTGDNGYVSVSGNDVTANNTESEKDNVCPSGGHR